MIAGAMALASVMHAQENSQQQQPAASPSNQAQQYSRPPMAVTVTGPVSIEREQTVEPNWAEPNCEKPSNHDEADLCQQRSMAKAAQQTVTLNYVQIGIGLVTLLGLGFTVYYTRETAKAAIAATRVAERALNDLERPFVYVEVTKTQMEFQGSEFRIWGEHLEFQCVNHGRSPADLWEVRDAIMLIPQGQFPAFITPAPIAGRQLPPGTVASPDKPFSFTRNLRESITLDEYGFIRNDHRVWLVGYVRYLDPLGNRYIVGFCAVFDPIGGRFVLRGDERYNYARQES